jgi:hypothetical protein
MEGLPYEILLHIFDYCIGSKRMHRNAMLTIYHISLTSKLFNNVMLMHPIMRLILLHRDDNIDPAATYALFLHSKHRIIKSILDRLNAIKAQLEKVVTNIIIMNLAGAHSLSYLRSKYMGYSFDIIKKDDCIQSYLKPNIMKSLYWRIIINSEYSGITHMDLNVGSITYTHMEDNIKREATYNDIINSPVCIGNVSHSTIINAIFNILALLKDIINKG